jgi:hypothetical protein
MNEWFEFPVARPSGDHWLLHGEWTEATMPHDGSVVHSWSLESCRYSESVGFVRSDGSRIQNVKYWCYAPPPPGLAR